ncbi:MAG TPA: DUF4296 domain-containing protein [Bacteroidales bacterium]|nr:DUF4296 domain-containing protein [Bacteroidales bacterium]HPT01947.1 DUF4296 domain-containing protein [Bacteroidales bacterium]
MYQRIVKIILVFLPVIMFSQACDKVEGVFSSRPSGVLSKKEMTSMLVDIHLQEAVIRTGVHTGTDTDMRNYSRSGYLKVFAKHDVTPEEFKKSLDYYLLHVDELDDIYTGVINQLTQMQAEAQGEKGAPAAKSPAPGADTAGHNVKKVPDMPAGH